MALQSSGAISLNDIHVEAGGSSGTTASINDSDIRGLIGKASGATMSFSEWYGASSLDLRTALSIGNIDNEDTTEDTVTVYSGIRMDRDGSGHRIYGVNSLLVSSTNSYQWLTSIGATNGDGFQIYVSATGPSVSSGSGANVGTFNTWLTMNTNRSWYLYHTGAYNGYTRSNYTMYFRPVGGSTVSAMTQTFQVEAATSD